ncbi:MAG: phosphoribosylformylglycinamidine cyclo-ligase [Thermoplasmata archaeon]
MLRTSGPQTPPLAYREVGVDIDETDAAKAEMADLMKDSGPLVLSKFGDYAALIDARFPGIKEPVLALKVEEPGSKQLLAFQHDRVEDVCRDMIAHLVNDVVVMGARPIAVLDVVVCGSFEKKTMVKIVSALTKACREQECNLVGGETSVQPGVLPEGRYILSATAVGVVERSKIIDRSRIRIGDVLLALPSSGPHTNGYSLIRRLLESQPDLGARRVGGQTFFEAAMAPHICYYQALKEILGDSGTHGIAHVTGGGIADNVVRIIPPEVDAVIELSSIKVPTVFSAIRDAGRLTDEEMLRVFNNGLGMVLAVSPERVPAVESHLRANAVNPYAVGSVRPGTGQVTLTGRVNWPSVS